MRITINHVNEEGVKTSVIFENVVKIEQEGSEVVAFDKSGARMVIGNCTIEVSLD